MRFIDLFAGLGGFHLAARALGGKCVFASEIDPCLGALYEANFGLSPVGDVARVDPSHVPDHDLLCAGFPCQPFSKAGRQSGWADRRRGHVFFRVIEILKVKRPTYVLLENVPHFVRHDGGNTYRRVCRALRRLGYDVQCRQLSPHQFAVPQIRERMYLVGKLGELNGFRWPESLTSSDELSLREVLDKAPRSAKRISSQVEDCLDVWQNFLRRIPSRAILPSFPIWSMEFGATYPYTGKVSLLRVRLASIRSRRGSFGRSLRLRDRRRILERLPSHARRDEPFPKWKQDFIRKNRSFYAQYRGIIDPWLPRIQRFPPSLQKLEWNCQGGERNIWQYVIQFRASGVRVKRPTTAPSLIAMTTTQVPIIAWERRYMTVRELARLQCMDKLRHLPGWTRAVTAFGNAVNVKVARLVLQSLLHTG